MGSLPPTPIRSLFFFVKWKSDTPRIIFTALAPPAVSRYYKAVPKSKPAKARRDPGFMARIGSKGGQRTFSRHGSKWMRKLAKKRRHRRGGRPAGQYATSDHQ